MEHHTPPLAIASIGRVYRHEATDATHDYVFHQLEGLVIGKHIAMTHLLGTLKTFFQTLFAHKKIDLRVRPGYFPFVEPGIEVDITCPFCNDGCSVCKHTRWIEMCGAGLVHPNVLHCTGIDSQRYSGFAFGAGLSRLAMLMYGIPDVRLLTSNKLNFLRQF
jgi:phenylalanyl-tRNA synthetase alpha chain